MYASITSSCRCSEKIPATKAGPAGDRGLIARGQVDQRHADLLARALRGGHRGVHPRPRAARRGRRRPVDGRVGRELLRLARRHRGRQAARGDRRTHASCRASSRSRTRSSRTSTTSELFSGERWERARREGRRKQRCLWASTSTKNPAYRDVLYVEELIGPRHGEHDARARRSRRSRITATSRDTLERGLDEAQQLLEELARGRRRLRRRHATRSSARAWRSSSTRSTSCSTAIRAASGGSSSPTRLSVVAGRARRADLGARPDASGPAHDEAQWLGWLDEPLRMRERLDDLLELAAPSRDGDRRRRPARHGRLVASRPRCCGARSTRSASTSSTRRTRRRSARSANRSTSSARCSSSPRSRATTLETRSHARLLLGAQRRRRQRFAAITDPGSALEQLARERGFRACSPASRRSAAATRRCRRSGSCRRR